MSFSLGDMFWKRYTGGSYVHTSHYFTVGLMSVPPTHNWRCVLGFFSDLGLYWAFITIYSYFATYFCRLFQNEFLNFQKKPHPIKCPQWLSTVSLTYLSKIFCSLQQEVTKFWDWVRITFGQQLLIKLSSRHCKKKKTDYMWIMFLSWTVCLVNICF